MVGPETNVALLNKIAASDAVRPFMRPDGQPMDFSAIEGRRTTEMGGVVLSNGEDAAGVFEITAPGVYMAHTMFGETCRGRKAIDTAHEMIEWMFAHGAHTVWGATPRANRKACLFNRLVGAREIGGDADDAIFEYRKAA